MIRITKKGLPVGYNGCYRKEEYIEKQRMAKLGSKNSCWKGGISYTPYRKIYHTLAKTLKQCCFLCGSITDKLIVHHLNKDFKDNRLENISIVCRGCHNKIHKSNRFKNDKTLTNLFCGVKK